jgi:hypothetical protein
MRTPKDLVKTTSRTILLVVSTWLTVSSATGAGLINGSFEAPMQSRYIEEYSAAPVGFGWTITTGEVDVLTSDYWQPSSGNQSAELNGTTAASIYQDFTFSDAGTWTVKFDMSANPDLFARGDSSGSGFKTLRVDFGIPGLMTNLGTYSLDSAPRTVGDMRWVTITTPEVVVSNSVLYRLQFTSLTQGIAGPVLDNVVLSRCGTYSTLRVSEVEFCWDSQPQHTYQVQYRSELTTNSWVDFLGTNVVGTGASICVPDRVPAGQSQRFYRVICLEQ